MGYTPSVCGYIAGENLYILCPPTVVMPGLQLITPADFKYLWRSDDCGARAQGMLFRPTRVIEMR